MGRMVEQAVEARVRARAHVIWEGEGRPEGSDQEHWVRALRELAAECEQAGHGEIVAPTPPQGRMGVAPDPAPEPQPDGEIDAPTPPQGRRRQGAGGAAASAG